MTLIKSPLSLLLGLSLAACSADDVADDGPIAMLVVGPRSGPNALIGEELENVANMVVNEAGGTVAGREIELVFVDSASDPAIAAENYAAAAQDPESNVVVGLLNWHSDVSVELMDVAADEGLAHIAALGASGSINEKFESDPERYRGWSKGWATPTKLGTNYVTAIEDAIASGSLELGERGRTVAIYGEDTSWGQGFGAGMRTALEDAGWTVVAEAWVEADGTDFNSTIDQFAAERPRLIAGTIATGSIYTFVSQVRSTFPADEQPLIVADGLGWNSDWFQTLGDASNGIVDQIPQFATQEAQDFASAYRDTYGSDPSPSAGGLAYDYGRFVLRVLEQAHTDHGTIDRASVLDVHATRVLAGELDMTDGILMSRYVWDGDSAPDPVVGGDAFTFPVLQYSSGESRVVWPESLKTSNTNIE